MAQVQESRNIFMTQVQQLKKATQQLQIEMEEHRRLQEEFKQKELTEMKSQGLDQIILSPL